MVYRNLQRDFDDLGLTADYHTFSSVLTLSFPGFEQAYGSYTYSAGDYQRQDSTVEFKQHLALARVQVRLFTRLQINAGVTYLRADLPTDIEKVFLSAGLGIDFYRGYQFLAAYNSYDYDNYLFAARQYRSELFQLHLRRQFNW